MKKLAMICRNANKLVKQGYTRSEAFKFAWRLAKVPDITAKVKGVKFGKRQEALERLTRYNAADVAFKVATDTRNRSDPNAVGVIAQVREKGAYLIGYLPKELASSISPLMKAGIGVKSCGTVTGGYHPFMNYGARVTLNFA